MLSQNHEFTFYVGLTFQHDVELDDLRWLTTRGRSLPDGQTYAGGRNRPILLRADDSTTSRCHRLGFVSQVVYQSTFLIDASAVEAAIQTRFNYLALGRRRLWHCVGKGRSSDMSDVVKQRVHEVFVTYSKQVVANLDNKCCKIQF